MGRAVALATSVRRRVSPRPWVGAVVVSSDGRVFEGATQPVPGPHAEMAALEVAGAAATGATLYTTLEPCSHTEGRAPGFTRTCADAVAAAGITRVVAAIEDPDSRVRGRGFARLRDAAVSVEVGVGRAEVEALLAPYLKHRSTGRPLVVLKLAASLDGCTAAPDGTSQWITGPDARTDVHRLRAESDAVIVGAGTVRSDDPSLTVRHVEGTDPLRVVLGRIPDGAKVAPALELTGGLEAVLDELGRRNVLQAMVEGGATVAGAFHRAGLVDRYILYLAPALFGGDDARGLFAGPGATTLAEVWRGRVTSVECLGDDLRVELVPTPKAA
ncbi:MAG: bifunctional diaminohydroxyphosphoribosylaminopyrimidine deaminase/5-amino-6-(5-phosphoribosylamino)uracil reductase RibD [Acidimicrobiia bacterium]|nr:bifunctional diaminohydroxyphosphoribosylaminopyrimidine deaminase/5-amino-6-(5-phosphoribosylamino)uracil reductase RibD [Acidimicrobiia bacterium]